MPIPNRADGPLAYPRRLSEFLRRNLLEHVGQQIESLVPILLLHLVPIVNDFILYVFQQIGFLADVRDRDCLD